MTFIYIKSITKLLTLTLIVTLITGVIFTNNLVAQPINGVQHLNKTNSNIGHFNGSTICLLGQICLDGVTSKELALATDGNFNTYAEWNNLASILSFQGLSFKSKNNNAYDANTIGAKISLSGTVNLNLFADYYIAALNNGIIVKQALIGNLATTSTILNNEQSFFIYLDSVSTFNEVRIFKNSLIGINNNFRLHEVFVLNSNTVGNITSNCFDFIQGTSTYTNIGGGLLSGIGGNVMNPNHINNATINDYAEINYLVNTANFNIGVADPYRIYNLQGNQRVGVLFEPPSSSLINTSVLEILSIKTYLHGKETGSYSANPTNNLLTLSALTAGSSTQKQKLSFNAVKPFNEVQLHFNGVAANINGPLKVYGFYTEPTSCGNCDERVIDDPQAAIKGSVYITSNNDWTGKTSSLTLGTISNEDAITSASKNDYAQLQTTVISTGGFRITIALDEIYQPLTYAGFTISTGTSLLNLNLLQGIKIKTYLDAVLQETVPSSSLISANVIGNNTNRTKVGLLSKKPFNRVMIEVESAINVLSDFRIYHLEIIKDSDNDGFTDCIDNFPNCDNSYDANNNGIPDGCDEANIVTVVSLTSNTELFKGGDTLHYQVDITNQGPQKAYNVDVNIPAPLHSDLIKWESTTTPNNITLPATSGSGSVNLVIPEIPVNGNIKFDYSIIPDTNYAAPSISSTAIVNTQPSSPDPTSAGDILTTPPLPSQLFPDLALSVYMIDGKITANQPLDVDLILTEMNGTPTEGQITIAIPKIASQYTINIPNRSTALNAIDTTNLSAWEIDAQSNQNYYFIKLKAQYIDEYSIHKQQPIFIPVQFVLAPGIVNVDIFPVTPRIRNFSGGEINNKNNDAIIYHLVNFN